jgi:hypothetical protein
LTKKTVIVTEPHYERETSGAFLNFLPDAEAIEPKFTWWEIRPEWIIRALGVLGFEDTQVTYHTQKHQDRDHKLYTVVGKRTHGSVGGVWAGQRETEILKVNAPNGIERPNGNKFIWLGNEPTQFSLFARKDLVATFSAEGVLMGPNLPGVSKRNICVKSSGKVTEFEIGDQFRIPLQLRSGANEVEIWCTDKPERLEHPGGDTRILLLGLINYRIER